MRKNSLMLFAVCATLLWAGAAQAKFPTPPPLTCSQRQTQAVQGLDDLLNLGQQLCSAALKHYGCDANVCQQPVFPGDGYPNPDAYGVSGHGPALSYTDNGDGTFTDNNTQLMWEEKKFGSGDVHDVSNSYSWSSAPPAANGTVFVLFLNTLNNKCDGDQSTQCTTNGDCSGIGDGLCGFAGHRDWRLPNIKELQSLVDYTQTSPAISSSVPGATQSGFYWSATTVAGNPGLAWDVLFFNGYVFNENKASDFYVRAVRSGL
jgi:hypothetical protein